MNHQPYLPIVEVTRGYQVESRHYGAVAAVDSDGRLVASHGSASHPIYVRSCAKPFQALTVVCSGAADAFGLTEKELALICASHSGEPEHLVHIESLLEKTGVDRTLLACGIHLPFDRQTRRELQDRGEDPTVLHNNCSAKHIGMLAVARHLGLEAEGYTNPNHGVQVANLGLLAYLSGLEIDEIGVSVDGCTVPTFLLPLRSFAFALARLAAAGEGLPLWRNDHRPDPGDDDIDGYDDSDDDYQDEYEIKDDANEGTGSVVGNRADAHGFSEGFPVPIEEGLSRVWRAMKNHPLLIAGSRGRICTELMKAASGFDVPLIAKSGAEGAYAMAAVLENQAVGIVIKIEDGGQRARDAAAVETLFQLDLLPEEARGPLAGYHRQAILSQQQEPVGEVRTCFQLSRGLPG